VGDHQVVVAGERRQCPGCHVDMALLDLCQWHLPAFEQGVAADGDDQQHSVADGCDHAALMV